MTISPEERERLLRKTVLLNRTGTEPLHAQLTRGLRNLIQRNFDAGEMFYPEETLSQELGLSVGTVRRSLTQLMDEGLLIRHRGKGSFVQKHAAPHPKGFQVQVMLNTYDSFFNRMLLRELSFRCQLKEYALNVANPSQDGRVADALAFSADQARNVGVVFLSLDADFTQDLHQYTHRQSIPSVSLDTAAPGYPGTSIVVDNHRGMELGIQHLQYLGHQRIALLVCEDAEHDNIAERIQSFQELMGRQSLPAHVVFSEPDPICEDYAHDLVIPTEERYDRRITEKTLREILATGAAAVLSVSDIGACMLIKRLHEHGKRVPQQMSVVGFNDEGLCRVIHPELTTIAQPYADMADLTIRLLETPPAHPRHFRLPPRLVVRNSAATPEHASDQV